MIWVLKEMLVSFTQFLLQLVYKSFWNQILFHFNAVHSILLVFFQDVRYSEYAISYARYNKILRKDERNCIISNANVTNGAICPKLFSDNWVFMKIQDTPEKRRKRFYLSIVCFIANEVLQ